MAKLSFRTRSRGFSLIEVMTAVVVLATGLLALASLQGSLVRNAADARTRAQVAATVEQVVETLRTDYEAIASDPDVDGVVSPAGVSNLAVAVASTEFDGRTGTFVPFDPAGAPLNPLDPRYKRLSIVATWTDSGGGARTLEFDTVVSPRTSGADSSTPFRTVSDGSDGALTLTERASAADVIQEGMIPIAVGDAQSAASNPKPKVYSADGNDTRVATTFDVLTYRPDGGDVIIRRRIENQVISCDCQYGSGDGTTPRWPAVWNGTAYEIYSPADGTAAPGAGLNAGSAHDGQSPLCTRCCRDHHDSDAEGVPKFDPEATAHGHYDRDGNLVAPGSTTVYVESCRMIRIDGLWQTASDMYSRHFGLLATENDARSGVPEATAVTAYQDFVKEYLAGYATQAESIGTAPTNADALFDADARGLNAPANLVILKAPPKDQRYLHARGLYVDFLGDTALEKLHSVIDNCPSGTEAVECLLPYLPFTTINVTELAFWAAKAVLGDADASSVLSVSTGSSQIYDPAEPTRGRVNATGGNGEEADAEGRMTRSNSGVAVVLGGIDPTSDAVASTDRQAFEIGTNSGNPGGIGQAFFVRLSGLPQLTDGITNNDPAVAWQIGTNESDCVESIGAGDTNPNDYVCTTSGALGVAGAVTVAEYYRVREENKSVTATCVDNQGNPRSATATVTVPVFYDYELTSVTHSGTTTVSSDSMLAEQSRVSLPAIAENDVIQIAFASDSPSTIDARVASCQTNGSGNRIENITWCRPWEQTCPL